MAFLMTKIQNVGVGDMKVKKINFSSTIKVCLRARESITIVPQQVKVIFASIWIRQLLLPNIPTSLFYFNLLFFGETITAIARRLISDTGVITLARFPTGRAVIVGIEWIAEVTALDDLAFALVGSEDIFTAIKRSESKHRKLKKH